AEGQVPEGGANDRRDIVANEDDDLDVCARLDSAFEGLAEHPRYGDAPAHPGQHRHARRWYECAARPLQYSGPDRYRPDVQPAARLSDDSDRERSDLRRLHVDPRVQAAAAGPDELLAELQKVLCQLPEGDVGICGHARERLCLLLAAEGRRARLRRSAYLRTDARGQAERIFLPGL